jgi:hypothetical protein
MIIISRLRAFDCVVLRCAQAAALAQWRDRGDVEGARAIFQRGVSADPGHLYIWQAWGCMEAKLVRALGRPSGRPWDRHWCRVVRSQATAPPASSCIPAAPASAQGNVDKARQLFQEGVWADPGAREGGWGPSPDISETTCMAVTRYGLHAVPCLPPPGAAS